MLRIGLTQGDRRGIGPELCSAALRHYADHPTIRLQLFGDPTLDAPDRTRSDRALGLCSAALVRDAVVAAQQQQIDAIVTAPINKQRWHTADIPAPGHTEWLAQCVDPISPPPTTMLFWSTHLRVALATLHLPLHRVSAALTADQLARTIRHTHDFLTRVLHRPPHLACLGLNPHAGEAGLLGDEEIRVIAPTLARCNTAGIDIRGPFPADTYFAHRATEHDAVIAMYHDQGLIPIKALAPHTAVNITLGLPILRVSPGHGTAEAIAGTGRADPRNFFAAIDTAAYLIEQTRSQL